MTLFIVFMTVVTLVWAAMFVLPLVGYAALGLSLLKSEKPTTRINRQKPVVHLKHSHA